MQEVIAGRPKMSVCMITYNHEAFISEAINSILNQVAGFDYHLVIGEDHSKDRTGEICQEFADRFPDKITLIRTGSNVGMLNNFVRTYRACSGEYIAFCEGDDFWTEPFKLQMQVDFLENNPSFSACFHNVNLLNQRNGADYSRVLHQSLPKETFSTDDVLGPWFVPSPSIVFRKYPDFILPDWFHNCRYGDLPFMLLLSLRGPFKYMTDVMATYRLHDEGVTTIDKNYDKVILMAYIYTSFNIHTNFEFHSVIRNSIIYEMDRHVVQPAVQQDKKEKKNRLFKTFFNKFHS